MRSIEVHHNIKNYEDSDLHLPSINQISKLPSRSRSRSKSKITSLSESKCRSKSKSNDDCVSSPWAVAGFSNEKNDPLITQHVHVINNMSSGNLVNFSNSKQIFSHAAIQDQPNTDDTMIPDYDNDIMMNKNHHSHKSRSRSVFQNWYSPEIDPILIEGRKALQRARQVCENAFPDVVNTNASFQSHNNVFGNPMEVRESTIPDAMNTNPSSQSHDNEFDNPMQVCQSAFPDIANTNASSQSHNSAFRNPVLETNGDTSNSNNKQDHTDDDGDPQPTQNEDRDDEGEEAGICKTNAVHGPSPEYDFDGEFPETETHDLTHFDFERLTKPEKEDLSVNQIDYKRYCRMFDILPNAHIVRSLAASVLRLCSQQLGTVRIKALCCALACNCTIYELEITEDEIDLQAMEYLVEAFNENNTVEDLNLRDNHMGRQPVKLLMNHLDTHDRLYSLNLSGNDLEDGDGDLFVRYLANSASLITLDLSNNHFREEGPEVLAKALVKNTTLSNLSLSWNHMREEGMRRFLALMAKNHGVECLDISWNGMGLSAVRTLGTLLKRNNTITTLDISANRINSKQLMEIANSLVRAKTIRCILIGNNVFSDNDLSAALKVLSQAKGSLSVKELDVLDMVVRLGTYEMCQTVLDTKDIIVHHGQVLGMDARRVTDEDELASLNPVTILIEFGQLLGLRLRDLFDFMDKDGNGILSREEIKSGLMEFDIPLPERSLDLLIRRMDTDGDGEISFVELLATGHLNTRKRLKERMAARDPKAATKHSTENERCRKILRRLIASNQKEKLKLMRKARKSELKQKELQERKKRKRNKEGGGTADVSEEGTREEFSDEDEMGDDILDDDMGFGDALPPIEDNNKVTP